ncbi:MAG: HlyD family efflux transporter periplasmic adaptor subunit [Planctomycetota bacterium]|nr:HlyD family efflux transporter periplasmic adaptor subunit [Planctomycetota bacterium]
MTYTHPQLSLMRSRTRRTSAHQKGLARSGQIWPFVLVMLLIPIIGGYIWYRNKGAELFGNGNDETPVTQEVFEGEFDHIVLEQGDIESSSNNEVKCQVKGRGSSGTPIISVLAEGTMVKKGDVICVLDSSALEVDNKSQRITVSVAESTVISSNAAVKQAEISRQEYLEGTYLTERKAILSEVAVAQQAVRTSELSLASAERLAAKGTLKSLQIEAEQFAVQNARNTLDAAQGRLRVLDELTKAKMLVQFDSNIETANAKLASDQSTLDEERGKLAEIQEQIQACTITAPADGQVVHSNRFSSRGGSAEFVVEPGAMVREQQTIVLLPDPTKMQVRAKVNESRITLIREQMPVRVKVGAVSDELMGTVVKVNKYAEPGNWMGSSVKEYAAFIQIIDPPPVIRTGMTAEVRIFVEQLPKALQIPVFAVYETEGHHLVLKQEGPNKWKTIEVQIGATNEKFVTINEGLAKGDVVVLNPRSHMKKMVIPDFPEIENREELAKVVAAANATRAKEVEALGITNPIAVDKNPATEARGPSTGEGAPSPGAIVTRIFQRLDTNADGKISLEEAASDERTASRFSETDKNGDGLLDRGEMTSGMAARMSRGAGAAGGPGGSGGPRSE